MQSKQEFQETRRECRAILCNEQKWDYRRFHTGKATGFHTTEEWQFLILESNFMGFFYSTIFSISLSSDMPYIDGMYVYGI